GFLVGAGGAEHIRHPIIPFVTGVLVNHPVAGLDGQVERVRRVLHAGATGGFMLVRRVASRWCDGGFVLVRRVASCWCAGSVKSDRHFSGTSGRSELTSACHTLAASSSEGRDDRHAHAARNPSTPSRGTRPKRRRPARRRGRSDSPSRRR